MSLLLPMPPMLELPDPVPLPAALPELSPWVLVPWLTRLVSKDPPRKRLVSLPEPLTLEPDVPWDPCELVPRPPWLCERDAPFVDVPELVDGLLCGLLLSNRLLPVAEVLLPGVPEAELVLVLELEMELPCVLSEPDVLEVAVERSISVEVETLPDVEVSSVPLAEVDPAGAATSEVLMEVLL